MTLAGTSYESVAIDAELDYVPRNVIWFGGLTPDGSTDRGRDLDRGLVERAAAHHDAERPGAGHPDGLRVGPVPPHRDRADPQRGLARPVGPPARVADREADDLGSEPGRPHGGGHRAAAVAGVEGPGRGDDR